MQFCFEALESTKISSYEPVSSQKYENGYRTKICIVECFSGSLIVKVRGQNSDRNAVKHTAQNWPKYLGFDEDAAGVMSLVPGFENSRLWNDVEFDPALKVYDIRCPGKWFRLKMNISNRSRDLAWSQGGTHDVTAGSTYCFSVICLNIFPFEFWPRTGFIVKFYGKKLIGSEIMNWSVVALFCSHQERQMVHIIGHKRYCAAHFCKNTHKTK